MTDEKEFYPCAKAMECLEQAELLENFQQPPQYLKRSALRAVTNDARRKKKPKQMTLKRAVKNMRETNFQGFDIERCTLIPSLNNAYVYIPKNYGGKTRKKYKNKYAPPAATSCCRHCLLAPCSMIEFKEDLTSTAAEHWLLPDTKSLDKVRTRYRHEFMKRFGKAYTLKTMKTNDDIPQCALTGTREVAADTGYDSLLDDCPFSRDVVLNRRDNDRELEEYRIAVEEDDKPLASLRSSTITEQEQEDSDEEFEFG